MTGLGLKYFVPDFISLGLLAVFLLKAILTGAKTSDVCPTKQGACSPLNTLVLGAIVLSVALFCRSNYFGVGFGGMLTADPLAFYFKVFFTTVFFVVAFMAREFFKASSDNPGEFGLILWCPLIGLYFLASATHLLVLFIALEILTMALYVMAAYSKRNPLSIEAGLKYLIMGSIASGFTIFGIALLYMKTGTLSFAEIAAAKEILLGSRLGLLALIFIFTGLGFKIATFPFQLWVPDVYQGSPAPVGAFMGVASKAAGFLLLLRLFLITVGPLDAQWKTAFAVLSLFTLFYGNLGALAQTSMKRLMGYSSIGHAGYLMLAVAAGTLGAKASILYYFAGYAASTLAVFYVITLIEKSSGSDDIENFSGLSQTSPFLSSVLFIALLSLAGVPPLAGFMGKFWILFAGLQAGLTWFVLAACAMVVVGFYYYLNIALKMLSRAPKTSTPLNVPVSAKIILILLSLLSLGIGLFQASLMRIAVTALS